MASALAVVYIVLLFMWSFVVRLEDKYLYHGDIRDALKSVNITFTFHGVVLALSTTYYFRFIHDSEAVRRPHWTDWLR